MHQKRDGQMKFTFDVSVQFNPVWQVDEKSMIGNQFINQHQSFFFYLFIFFEKQTFKEEISCLVGLVYMGPVFKSN